jgi:hypothetical protein
MKQVGTYGCEVAGRAEAPGTEILEPETESMDTVVLGSNVAHIAT